VEDGCSYPSLPCLASSYRVFVFALIYGLFCSPDCCILCTTFDACEMISPSVFCLTLFPFESIGGLSVVELGNSNAMFHILLGLKSVFIFAESLPMLNTFSANFGTVLHVYRIQQPDRSINIPRLIHNIAAILESVCIESVLPDAVAVKYATADM